MFDKNMLPPVIFTLTADLKQFKASMDGAQRELDDLEKDGVGKAQRFKAGLQTAVIAGAAAIAGFLTAAVKEAADSQQVFAQLTASVESLGQSMADIEPAVRQAGAAMVQLGFDDDAAYAAFTKLNTALKDSDQALSLLPVAADLARAANMDLTAAAEQLALASTGSGRVFRKFGIVMDTSIKDPAERGKKAMEELAAVLEGRAAAHADTFNGAVLVLRETFSNFMEEIGNRFLPYIQFIIEGFSKATAFMQENADVISYVLIGAVAALTAAAVGLAAAWVVANAPLIFTVVAIGALAAAMVYGWNTSEGFRNAMFVLIKFVGNVFIEYIKNAINAVQIFVTILDKMMGAMATAARWLGKDDWADTFDSMGDSLRNAGASMEGWEDKVKDLQTTLNSAEFEDKVKSFRYNFNLGETIKDGLADFEGFATSPEVAAGAAKAGKKVADELMKAVKKNLESTQKARYEFGVDKRKAAGDIREMLKLAEISQNRARELVAEANANASAAKTTKEYAIAIKALTAAQKYQTQVNSYARSSLATARNEAERAARAIDNLTNSYARNNSYLASMSRVSGSDRMDTYIEVPVMIDGQVVFRTTQKYSLLNNRRNVTNGLATSGSVL